MHVTERQRMPFGICQESLLEKQGVTLLPQQLNHIQAQMVYSMTERASPPPSSSRARNWRVPWESLANEGTVRKLDSSSSHRFQENLSVILSPKSQHGREYKTVDPHTWLFKTTFWKHAEKRTQARGSSPCL